MGTPILVDSPDFKALVVEITRKDRTDEAFGGMLAVIEDWARSSAEPVRIEHCSAFDREGKRWLVNLGAGTIVQLTPAGITNVLNGEAGVLFIDEPGFEPVPWEAIAAYDGDPKRALVDFAAAVLDFPPLATLTPKEARALGLGYWIGVFFDREFSRGRPLLLFVGPIGSGKTMCSRKYGVTYYGRDFEVSVSASADRGVKDLAASVAHTTLTIRDDLNDAPAALADLLLCVSTGAKFDLSEFHKTLATKSYPMRGAVAFTASKPKWAKRVDLLSRLLVIRVERDEEKYETEESEEDRLARAYRARAAGWYLALDALTHVLASDERPATVTRFRSWEQGVCAALKEYGLHDALLSGLQKMHGECIRLPLDADPFLALLLAVARKYPGHEWRAAELHDALANAAGMRPRDDLDPHVARARNPQELGKLLEHIERDGTSVVRVERISKAHGNVSKWALYPREEDAGSGGSGGSRSEPISSRSKNKKGNNRGRTPPDPPTPPKSPKRKKPQHGRGKKRGGSK